MGKHNLIERAIAHGGRDNVSRSPTRLPEARSFYPPGTPNVPIEHSTTGKMHDIAALPMFLGIPAGAFTCAWRFQRCGRRGWALYSGATGVLMLTTTGLFGAGFSQKEGLVSVAGLFQRIAIVTGFGWLTGLSVRARRHVFRAGPSLV